MCIYCDYCVYHYKSTELVSLYTLDIGLKINIIIIRHRWEDWTMAATEEICPKKFTTMIESLYTGMMVNVRNGGEVSDTFAITNGVK